MAETFETMLAATTRSFRDGGIDTPSLDARLLLCHAAGLTHEAAILRGREALQPETAARLEGFVARRLAGEPVSRILGMREFYGRSFRVDSHTLDPRPDTETLIEAALDLVARNGWRNRQLKLLDLGTGTGCILLTLLAELPQAEGIGTDRCEGALRLAADNARRLGVAGRPRFVAADWLQGMAGRFDLILSNPPYIPTGDMAALSREVAVYDPRLALDGGADGLEAYRRIAARAPSALRPGGSLIVEIGATQAQAATALFRAAGLVVEEDGVRLDLASKPRCVVAKCLRGGAERRMTPKISLEKPDVRGRFMPGN